MTPSLSDMFRLGDDPNRVIPEYDIPVGYAAWSVLTDLAESPDQPPPPKHLWAPGLLELAAPYLWDGRDPVNEVDFDVALDMWCDWYSHGLVQAYCRRYGLGEVPGIPEPAYGGPEQEALGYHKRCYVESFRRP